ncbi:hypothetical protein GGP91_001107 [Salinibacter ruber]|nr:hypothetical protein [Salinibacter ruber]MCS3829048.1 hypothetical protein [Salinibacter ruber]MCS4056948.1 hypothetical protein [Salinibacter ruber]MCS4059581.1 hypothetical protein [Salinibacter ruber]MCS4161106.1 hypothetical protein [Salinibacter ruber]
MTVIERGSWNVNRRKTQGELIRTDQDGPAASAARYSVCGAPANRHCGA